MPRDQEASWQRARDLQKRLYEGGFAGICFPREYGGLGLDIEYQKAFDAETLDSINERNRIFGRFSDYTVDRQDPPWTGNPLAGNGNFATQYHIRGKAVALSWTSVISPSVLNELRGGFSRDNAHSDPVGLTVGSSAASQYGLTGIPAGPYDAGIPPINISGSTRARAASGT